jgi:hypothetical protein
MAAARTALLTALGRALGATAASDSATTPQRALPASLYYDGPPFGFKEGEPRRPRPVVSLAPPTRLDREAWELARRGDEDRLRFILTRSRERKARKPENTMSTAPAPLQHDPLAKMVELQDGRVREILAAIPGGSWGGRA